MIPPGKKKLTRIFSFLIWYTKGLSVKPPTGVITVTPIKLPRFKQSASLENQRKVHAQKINYNYYVIDNQVELTGQNSSQKSNNLEIQISLGYFHTFVINKKFYISAGLTSGGGIIHINLLTRLPATEDRSTYTYGFFRTEGADGLGYNADRIFAGLYFLTAWGIYNQGQSATVNPIQNRFSYDVFIGYQLNSPKFLQKKE